MTRAIELDVLILGGGIAGLWTLDRLRGAGYSCVLLERSALGSGQTVASQGIIHGGVKYALSGAASRASKAIAAMPSIWSDCLRGLGAPDLSEVRVLSESCVMWTTPGLGSRLAGLAASRAIRNRPEAVEASDRPPVFGGAPRGVDVYAMPEPVLDPRSLVSVLAAGHVDAIGRAPEIGFAGTGAHDREIRVGELVLRPRVVIAAAGDGNESIARSLGDETDEPMMQRRALHMVMVRKPVGEDLPMIFGHCIGRSSMPRATITTGTGAGGRRVWWVGGQIAERGVDRDLETQLGAAREELATVLPWVDLSRAQLAAVRIDRAEGFTPTGRRPDEPVIREIPGEGDPGGVPAGLVCWPTKLAFAPAVAERVLERLAGLAPRHPQPVLDLERPPIADLPWDAEGVRWH